METRKVNVIHYIICAALCLLFRFVPPVAGLTELGMGIIGTFLGAIYGWVMIDLLWPSMLALCGVGLSIGMNAMMQGSFGNVTVVSLIVCMATVGVAMESGAFNWLSMKLLTNKYLEGKGYLTLFVVFMVAWLTGAKNPIVMCLVFCGFLGSLFKQVGVKKDDPVVVFSFLGVAYQLMRGQILFPFMGGGLAYINAYNNMFPTIPLPVPRYILMMAIMGPIMAIVYLLLMKYAFRVDVSALSNYKIEGGVPAITKAQKWGLGIFIAFIVLNVFALVGPVKDFLSLFGIVGIGIVLSALLPIIKDENGKPIGDLEFLFKQVSWGQVFMIGYVMVISTQMMSPATGIRNAIAYVFAPFMDLPPIVFVVTVMIIATIITNFANNMLSMILCMPFLVSFAESIGMNPVGMVCLLFIISEFALATPAASPVTAVAFSYTEWVSSSAMSRAAAKLIVPLFITFLVVAWPLQAIIFG